jgi:type II secretory pathway predicted ATPase ExeA
MINFIEYLRYYNIEKDFSNAGNYNTEHSKLLNEGILHSIRNGKFTILTGLVGSGKTTTVKILKNDLENDKKIITARLFSSDKRKVGINELYAALFFDIQTDKDFKIPSQGEAKARKLIELIKQKRKTVALFIDDAHGLHGNTLISIKTLIENIESESCNLSVILVGHPKLKNDISKPIMEEIGARANIFSQDGVLGAMEHYIQWLLRECISEEKTIEEIIDKNAIEFLSKKLVTPLQVNFYLKKCFEIGFEANIKPINIEVAEKAVVNDIESYPAKLSRAGYSITALTEYLGATSREIKTYLAGQLNTPRAQYFNNEIYKLGIV